MMKLRDRDKLLNVIIENYNLTKNGCILTNHQLATYLALEKIDDKKSMVSDARISYLLRALIKIEKIKITYMGATRRKVIKLIGEVLQNETVRIYVEKHKNNA